MRFVSNVTNTHIPTDKKITSHLCNERKNVCVQRSKYACLWSFDQDIVFYRVNHLIWSTKNVQIKTHRQLSNNLTISHLLCAVSVSLGFSLSSFPCSHFSIEIPRHHYTQTKSEQPHSNRLQYSSKQFSSTSHTFHFKNKWIWTASEIVWIWVMTKKVHFRVTANQTVIRWNWVWYSEERNLTL